MSRKRRHKAIAASPLLTPDQIEQVLHDELIPDWYAPWHVGMSGFEIAVRYGFRFQSDQRVLQVARTPVGLARLRDAFQTAVDLRAWSGRAPNGDEAAMMVAVVRAGRLAANPCVVQAIWSESELQLTAHAKENLFPQRTCTMALAAIERLVGGRGPSPTGPRE